MKIRLYGRKKIRNDEFGCKYSLGQIIRENEGPQRQVGRKPMASANREFT